MGTCFDKDKEGILVVEPLDTTPLKDTRALIIFVVGGPGVGKNTLCIKLASNYGLFLISVSDILREEVSKNTAKGQYFKSLMVKGVIVPAEIVFELVVEKMLSQPKANGYLISGFPRDKKQALMFNNRVRPPNLMINLYARRVILQERMVRRAISSIKFDDTVLATSNRLKLYYRKISGAIEPNKAVTKVIDAETTANDVYREACKIVNELIQKTQ